MSAWLPARTQFYYKGAEVDQVNLPSSAGDMGVLANHVPTLAQLRPGVVEVNDGKATKKFFGMWTRFGDAI